MKKTFYSSSGWSAGALAARTGVVFLCLTGLLGAIAPNSIAGARAGQEPQDQQDPNQVIQNQADPNQTDANQAGPIQNGANPPGADQAGANQPGANQVDPPTRVARISYFEGSVSMQPGGSGDWAATAKNRPVTVGDKLWSDKDSRLELQAGQANIHVGSMTALSFLNLDQSIIQMRVPEGAVNFRVRELREGDVYEVDTPNVSFLVKEAGGFRVDVSENGDGTRVTVIRGLGEVTASGKTYTVHAGERAEFNGTDDNVQYEAHGAPPPDGLDKWANDRDLREDDSVSAKYVSRDTVGYADLDNNGTWNEEPDYGPVWYPNDEAPGWAPYSNGAWNWVGPWGWTWVGYEPWGFAPYHYGRWNYFGSRWGWCPGIYGGYPIYGPAFVGFLGGGFGFGFGGGIGWFPLGFGEPFRPWYRAGGRYINNINIHNTTFRNSTVINNSRNFNYAYAHNSKAVTAASRSTFVNGQAVNRGSANITAASLRGAQVTTNAGISPTRQSLAGTARTQGRVATPPSSVQNRSVMARTSPAAGASSIPVRTMNSANLSRGNAGSNSRNQQVAQNRPVSSLANGANSSSAQRGASGNNSGRTWEAQGNSTDGGRAPQGFGSGNPSQSTRGRSDRPAWAGSGQPGGAASTNSSRGYAATQNSPSAQSNRGYSTQWPSNSAPSRTYSAPSRSYPAPSRSYSAPSRSSGGGGAPHGSGGAAHASGGGSHGHH
jgi:hypothetical protein